MQLFAHLLSSYLQGMGDFFSALQRKEKFLLAVDMVVTKSHKRKKRAAQ